MFKQSDFTQLAAIKSPDCLTMYIPTNRAGAETYNGHDALVLKGALKEARIKLSDGTSLSDSEIDQRLKPIEKLVEDEHFWRYQSDALAIFIAKDVQEIFHIPVPLKETLIYVNSQFVLKEVSRLLAPASRWYVYAVTQDKNQFFECTRKSITSIYIDDLVPADMEEALEVYEGGESLQHHGKSRQTLGGGGSVYTGQGSNEDRRDERLEILFRRLGNGITKLIAGQNEPLIIVADDQYISEIQSSIDYPHIVEESVTINPAQLDPVAIQRETWRKVQPMFDLQVEEIQSKFASANGGGTLANGLADVVVAANKGQVAALYVSETATDRTGRLTVDTNAVEFGATEQDENLLEKAIRETVAHGGQVMFRMSEQVPDRTDGVSAVLRYSN